MRGILAALVTGMLVVAAGCKSKESVAGAAAEPAAGKADASGLVVEKVLVDGHLIQVAHSRWDGGQTVDLFDDDPQTLARTENANPAILEITLLQPRPIQGISVTTATMDAGLTATLRPRDGGPAKTFRKEFLEPPTDPTLQMDFDTGATPIASLRVEIQNLNGGDGHIHLRTLRLP